MAKLTDNDKKFGPITYGKTDWNALRLVVSSGGDGDDSRVRNNLTGYAFGWCAQINLPNLINPFRIKHMARTWDAATVQRMGRDFYYETHPKEYGFSLSDGFLQIFKGAQTHDSDTTQSWCATLPWTQWRHVRFSLYDKHGKHFWTQSDKSSIAGFKAFDEQRKAEEECDKVAFYFIDYDGKSISATTHIQEREWKFGTKWCKWLSLFSKSKIQRTLNLKFSSEVGPEKGSWKGGTTGHSIEMLPGELHEAAFKRYCEQEHRSKYSNFKITFVA